MDNIDISTVALPGNISNTTTSFSFRDTREIVTIGEQGAPALDVNGRIRINGEYLDERLERIETLLNIPTRDVTIEAQYPKLKALYNEYMQELEKYKTWNRLTKGTEK